MDLAVNTTSYQLADDNSWLGSAKGVNTAKTITIDPAKGFVSGTHYPNGFLPSGIPLGKVTANNTYGLYDDAATDGRQTCVGFLLGSVKLNPSAPGTVKVGGALLWEGRVLSAKLPFAVDANGKTDLAAKFLVD